MSDTNPTVALPGPGHDPDQAATPARRRGPDLLTLAAGLGSLGVASTVLFDGVARLPGLEARWVLATLAMLVGLALVVGSLRPRRVTGGAGTAGARGH